MAVTEEFIENVCKSCEYFNNPQQSINKLVRTIAEKEIDRGAQVCGHCGCNLQRMITAGKACPIGKSGENKGLWRLLKGRGGGPPRGKSHTAESGDEPSEE